MPHCLGSATSHSFRRQEKEFKTEGSGELLHALLAVPSCRHKLYRHVYHLCHNIADKVTAFGLVYTHLASVCSSNFQIVKHKICSFSASRLPCMYFEYKFPA